MNKNLENKNDIDLSSHTLEWREGDMPYSTGFGDYYYSKSDGRLECDHVFIDGNDLKERFANTNAITIAELGFGTGLNFLETVRQFKQCAASNAKLNFHSFEINPLNTKTIKKALSIWPELNHELHQLLTIWPEQLDTDNLLKLDDNVVLHLHIGDVNKTLPKQDFRADAWFLDGFAPVRNQSMWSLELMRMIANYTQDGGTFSSYTAAGWVRRNLIEAGFVVRKTKGYASKRDMICGTKTEIEAD
ncbi:MAG: tRNA (5-methylaminomethyl-2-thiouridine)(34)-methyltransferase MnmD [Lentilitoribacter sp.]